MRSLTSLLDNLIEFRLFQPKDKEAPKGDPPFKEGQVLDYVEQEHNAKRAGRHTDLRIGNKRGMYSWATRKDLPEPGGRIQLHPQPIHPHHYNSFKGEIKEGYGAGTVSPKHIGKALVTHAQPGQTNITVASKRGDHRLALLNTRLGHLLVREKHPEPPQAQKPKMKSVGPEALDSIKPGTLVQPKIDGALSYLKTTGGRLEVFSHRKSKRTGRQIIHTERVLGGRPRLDIPKEHQHTILGEIYGTKHGKAIEPQELGGLLNAHIDESLRRQKEKGIKLKIAPFDVTGKGTYPERLARLKETVRHLPKDKFTIPESAQSPGAARRLFERIRSGRHPLTKEGVIIHSPTGKSVKIKNTEEANVEITGVFAGEGKYSKSHGGILYKGGKVGTGFTDETRGQLHKYIGRTARIRHHGKYKKTGAYRAPSFIAVNE